MVSKINSIFITLALSIFLAQSVESATIPYTMNKRFSQIYQHGQQSDKLETRQIDDNDAIHMKRTILSGNDKRLKDLIPDTEKRQNDEDTIYVKRTSGVNGRIGDSRVHVKQPSKRQDKKPDEVGTRLGSYNHSKQPSKRQDDEDTIYVKREILGVNERIGDVVHVKQPSKRQDVEKADSVGNKNGVKGGGNVDVLRKTSKRQDDEDTNYVKRILGANERVGDIVHVKQPSKRQDVEKANHAAERAGVQGGSRVNYKEISRRQTDDENAPYVKRIMGVNECLKDKVYVAQPSKRQMDDEANYVKRTILSGDNQRLGQLVHVPESEKRQDDEDVNYVKRVILGSNKRVGDFVHVEPSKRETDRYGALLGGGERVHSKQPSKRQIDHYGLVVKGGDRGHTKQPSKRQDEDGNAPYVKREILGVNERVGDKVHVKQSSKRQSDDEEIVYTKRGDKLVVSGQDSHPSKRENDVEEEI